MGKRYEQGGPELNSALFRDYGATGRIYRDRMFGQPDPREVLGNGMLDMDVDEGSRSVGIRWNNTDAETTTVRVVALDAGGNESATATYSQTCPPGTTTVGSPPATGNTAIPMRSNPSRPGKLHGVNIYTGGA